MTPNKFLTESFLESQESEKVSGRRSAGDWKKKIIVKHDLRPIEKVLSEMEGE